MADKNITSKRKNTGRTDKYSEGSPEEAYAKYRKDYPKEKETARKESEDISLGNKKEYFIGKKSFEARKQELEAHVQSYQETFGRYEIKNWKNKLNELIRALEN